VWPQLHIGTVIKRTEKKRVVEITRTMAHGLLEQAEPTVMLTKPQRERPRGRPLVRLRKGVFCSTTS
jgi:hypothetical protein